MRSLVVGVIVLACACSKKEPPPKNEFEVFEREFRKETAALVKRKRAQGEEIPKKYDTTWRTVFIGPSGVFVDRKVIATLAELETKREQISKAIIENEHERAGEWRPSVVLDLDAQPASVAVAALRLFMGREVIFSRPNEDPESVMASRILCTTTLRDTPAQTGESEVALSVYLTKDRTWLGLSRINEFQELPLLDARPDVDKLHTVLREHKASAFFADRSDVEIAADAGTAGDVLSMLDEVCRAGFIDVALLDPEKISAKPSL